MTTTTIKRSNTDMPGIASANLTRIVDDIERYGIQIEEIQQWRTLTATSSDNGPNRPPSLLALTPDQLREYAKQDAISSSITGAPDYLHGRIWRDLKTALNYELKDVLKTRAAQIIEGLRPAFDQAADTMRRARAAGISPEATAESLLEASDEARRIWPDCKKAANQLEAIFKLRQELSIFLAIAPAQANVQDQYFLKQLSTGEISTGIQWETTILRPNSKAILAPLEPNTPWRRWLTIADDLELTIPEGL